MVLMDKLVIIEAIMRCKMMKEKVGVMTLNVIKIKIAIKMVMLGVIVVIV